MKLMLGNTPVKKMMIHNDTMDATMVPSDLQSGVTCYAKGQKITGTGKSFEFAQYGQTETNMDFHVPTDINVIQVSCVDYPVKSNEKITDTKNLDYTSEQTVATLVIDSIAYPIKVVISNNIMSIICDKTVYVQVFYGKDNYT